MGLIIYCENVKAETIYEQLGTDICGITNVKWQASVIAAVVMLVTIFYMMWKFKYRCHKTLLTFHNLRAAVAVVLFAINTIELAKAMLPVPQYINDAGGGIVGGNNGYENIYQGNGSEGNLPPQTSIDNKTDYIYVVIGFVSLTNSLAALFLTIILIWYHRLVELKKSLEFLYVSSILTVLIFILRIYELAEVVYYDSIMALEAVIQTSSAICLLLLAIIDGFTVYKERYRPEYLENHDKIGYRHTLATFYSKACFWWLTPLLWFGYKEPLELEDLGQMRVEDSARAHYDRFLLIYKTAKVKNSNKPPSLWLCYLNSSWRMFTLGGLLKLFGDLFAVIAPLAIQQIVQYIENMYGMQYSKNNNNNQALLQLNTSKSNMTNSNNISSRGNNNTSNTAPEIQTSLSSISSSLLEAASLLSFEQKKEELLSRSSRSAINMQAVAVVKMVKQVVTQAKEAGVAAATATAATGSIWLPNLTVTYTNDYDNNNNDNSSTNYDNNTNVYNQIANGIDYIDTTFNSSLTPAYSNLYSSGAEVKIYYPTWLDLLSNGWAIAWLVLLAALAQGALSQASTHILNMTGIRIKTSLQGLIYRKTLLLNSSCIGGSGGSGAATENDYFNSHTNESANKPTKPPIAGSKTENSMNTNCHNNMFNNSLKDTNCLKDNKMKVEEVENSLNDIGAITNLMSEDTLNIMSFFWIAHYVWAIPLKIGIVMYLLYLKLGISAVIGSFVCILTMTPLQFLIGKAMSQNTEVMAKYTDNRLRKLHDCFVGIKLIKLNAWDNVFIKKITEARHQELKYLNKDSFYWTIMTILTHICSVLITFVTLAVYVYRESGEEFTASCLFSALALFQQLTVPLLIFPITVPIILSAVVSTKRLESFLAANEIQKQFEGIRHMARILSKSDASLDMYEVKDKSQSLPCDFSLKSVNEKPKIKINIPDKPAPLANSEPHTPLVMGEHKDPLRFTDDHKKLSLHARKELLRNTPYVVIRPKKLHMTGLPQTAAANTVPAHVHRKTDSWHRDSLLLKMPDDVAVSVKDCKFSWNPQKYEPILYIRDIFIPSGKLTMIVGKNGSGKSSLLSALLMEMPLISGDMIWNKTSTIAFVPQQPWLLNASIRENILFGESFRPRRYEFVLEACALKPDIELMPAGDLTVIGERGINLSGGQRQRVAIARALYSSANVVIMDDPLSSLDNEVARHIFEQSIKKMLLKANRTVILVTQQLNLLQQAHNLIVLKDGCLQASGSYKDIEVTHPHLIAKWNSIIAKANAKEQQNNCVENAALGRTARERWKLFKNVAKLGLQRTPSLHTSNTASGVGSTGNNGITSATFNSHSEVDAETDMKTTTATTTSMENIMAADDDDDDDDAYNSMMPMHHNTSFKLKRTPSAMYGSRHLLYDVPLPLDECQTENVILRRRRRTTSRSDSQQKVRPSSRTSSRLSNISNTPTELRRSLLTNSCSSANSYMTNISSSCNIADEASSSRTQSWQPTSEMIAKQHQPVSRNVSSPPTFDEQHVKELDERDSNAVLVADLEKTSPSNNGFQHFLRRMTMRKSFKPKGVQQTSHSRKLRSNRGSILSISEESGIAGCSAASLPLIELSSVAVTTDVETEIETESWIAGIENEESIQDANIDYKILVGNNNENVSMKTGADIVTTSNKQTKNIVERTTKLLTTATTSYDVERKYGKIPAEIYLLYLRASGLTIVLIFFITALIWQTLRVFTDVWLQQWTDDSNNNNNYIKGAAVTLAAVATTTKNISATVLPKQQITNKYATVVTASASAFASVSPTMFQSMDHHNSHEVTYYFHIYAAISCVCIVMAMLSTPAGQWAGCKARQNLHDKLLHSIMHKSLHFFQTTPLGRIMNRFSNDMAIIDKKIAATSQRLLQFTLLCLCAILINVIITPWFMVVTIPVCLAYYAIQKFYRCSSRELQRIENATNSPVISHLSETIQGVTTIRAYNQESRFTEILFKRLEDNTIAFTILNTSNRWLGISLDYLGGVIVFVAIVTALLAATIACNNYNKQLEEQQQQQQHNDEHVMTTSTLLTLLPLTPTPSLVGLAINYTLLMPIYLNWVVKLLADMEMYVGSVERIAYYAETTEKMEDNDVQEDVKKSGQSKDTTETTTKDDTNSATEVCCGSNNNCKDNTVIKVNAQQESCEDILSNTSVTTATSSSQTTSSIHNNDKLLNLSENNKTTDSIVDATSTSNVADDDDDTHHQFTNDGHIAAVTTKTFSHKQQTTATNAEPARKAGATKCDDNNDNKTNTRIFTTTNKVKNNKSSISSNSNTSSHPLKRNDAERRKANVRSLPKYKKQYKPVAISWPQRGDISFENVSLRYEGQTEDVIKNLNLTIPAGQRIGICGRTGSGKSSLALSLFGVLQISNGCIRIDDNDIAAIHPNEIRTRLSIIPQDVHLFSMTVRENLDPSGYYSDLELWNCLELAQLKEFVNTKMPQGLDTKIMDGGLNLSVGHRQLFCLARAILRGSVCLVLDEATSSLDSSTEKALLQAAHKAFQGRTIITIAHRLSTIMDYDRIIVLNQGQIIEDGSPQQLKLKPDGIFSTLIHSGRPLSALSLDSVLSNM